MRPAKGYSLSIRRHFGRPIVVISGRVSNPDLLLPPGIKAPHACISRLTGDCEEDISCMADIDILNHDCFVCSLWIKSEDLFPLVRLSIESITANPVRAAVGKIKPSAQSISVAFVMCNS